METIDGLLDTKGCHCLAARMRSRELTRLYEEKLRPHGLRATQFSILAVLGVRGPTRVGDLAGILGLERTTLTRSAAVLEREGRVSSAPTEDARVRRWELTASGRRALQAALPAWREAQRVVEGEESKRSSIHTRDGEPG